MKSIAASRSSAGDSRRPRRNELIARSLCPSCRRGPILARKPSKHSLMNVQQQKQISKSLSHVLRHRPDSVGLELGEHGWVSVEKLLRALETHNQTISLESLQQVVAQSDKQRFELSEDGQCIRARQGHSAEIDVGYAPATPPAVLYHGTAMHNLDSIFEQGLLKGQRHHVHMSTDQEAMLRVGMRHGKPVLFRIDAAGMHDARHQFFLTGNNVWLTEHVPPEYLRRLQE
jgi:putative RNA 2'-phosphotransferase